MEAFVRRIEAGEEFIITRYGHPVAKARAHRVEIDPAA
jgi:antitoxin (DNA-binding transcriptional repressor) of toxin-antitoxin stability system